MYLSDHSIYVVLNLNSGSPAIQVIQSGCRSYDDLQSPLQKAVPQALKAVLTTPLRIESNSYSQVPIETEPEVMSTTLQTAVDIIAVDMNLSLCLVQCQVLGRERRFCEGRLPIYTTDSS